MAQGRAVKLAIVRREAAARTQRRRVTVPEAAAFSGEGTAGVLRCGPPRVGRTEIGSYGSKTRHLSLQVGVHECRLYCV